MSAGIAARLAWSLFALSVLLFVAAVALNLLRPQYSNIAFTGGELVVDGALLVFGWFGALIVSRQPGQSIGRLLCAFGLTAGVEAFANEYAIHGLVTSPGTVPAAAAVAWLASWEYAMHLGLLAALLVLFPTGRPLSKGGWWVLWMAGIANGLSLISALSLWPQRGVALLRLYDGAEPIGLFGTFYAVGFVGALAVVVVAAVLLVVRFRHSVAAERAQIKWLIAAVVTVVVGVPVTMAALTWLAASELAFDIVGGLLIALIPVAVGTAILEHRLYDIDRLINRTVVYALLTASLGTVYAGVVVGLGHLFGGVSAQAPSWVVAAATLAVAGLFGPARRGIQHAVDRRFNRRDYNAARTTATFSTRLRDQLDQHTVAAELLMIVDQTMQPAAKSLWLRSHRGVDAPRTSAQTTTPSSP